MRLQHLDSPISQNEYVWNQAVYDEMNWYVGREVPETLAGRLINTTNESLEIIANPTDGPTFLKVEDWINAVQRELDTTWAVLVEEYTCNYKLSIHRVNSNLFNENARKTFNEKFLTKRASLTANPEIARLMVLPLYGDDPSYGIRELLQNAVDACNERVEWTKMENERKVANGLIPILCPEGKIEINIDTKSECKLFTITDNGIGMTEDIITGYYLVAGNSFRESSEWRESYIGYDGNPNVVRSGRFGIGALAAFLLGNEVEVTTRHVGDTQGYRFKYGIDSIEPLQVERVHGLDIGTKVCIELTREIQKIKRNDYPIYDDLDDFDGMWQKALYFFKKPKVKYKINNKQMEISKYLPNKLEDKNGWLYCESNNFESIHWLWKWGYVASEYNLYYNGLIIDYYLFFCQEIKFNAPLTQ
jgi:hypothetical protein